MNAQVGDVATREAALAACTSVNIFEIAQALTESISRRGLVEKKGRGDRRPADELLLLLLNDRRLSKSKKSSTEHTVR